MTWFIAYFYKYIHNKNRLYMFLLQEIREYFVYYHKSQKGAFRIKNMLPILDQR